MTLRELAAMFDARRRHDWRIVASLRAGIANGPLRPRGRRGYIEDDFDPFASRRGSSGQPLGRREFERLREVLFRYA